ncbi:SH3 domain-containing protein [Leptospira wolffii]|uniref:SH3 domain-containing protein n=1 Tax=Leptospira wolffii TaxID=409998 RepID=UPI0013FE3460|nr:SH3 domain-containing protein [Leptospira wolffii]
MRNSPNTRGEILGKLKIGSKVQIITQSDKIELHNGRKDRWYYISDEKDKKGWVFGGFLSIHKFSKSLEKLEIARRINSTSPEEAFVYLKEVLSEKPILYSDLDGLTSHDYANELLGINECYRSRKQTYYKNSLNELIADIKLDFLSKNFANLKDKGSCSMYYATCYGDSIFYVTNLVLANTLNKKLNGNILIDKNWKIGSGTAAFTAEFTITKDSISYPVELGFKKTGFQWEWTGYCANGDLFWGTTGG